MLDYKKYKLLQESFGSLNLGLSKPTNLGINSQFNFEEAKKGKKKMDGDLVDDEEDDDDEVKVKVSKDVDVDDVEDDEEDDDVEDIVDDEEEDDDDDFCPCSKPKIGEGKKCMKCMKKMKKKMSSGKKKKKMKEESIGSFWDQNYQTNYTLPEVGSSAYRTKFFESINNQMSVPQRNYDGTSLHYEEDVLVSPHDRDVTPSAGEVGFAPQGRVDLTPQQQAAVEAGIEIEDLSGHEPAPEALSSNWMSSWSSVEDYLEEKGLTEDFELWLGKKMLIEAQGGRKNPSKGLSKKKDLK